MLSLLLLIIGFVPLIFGGNFLVDGATSIAKKYKVPNMVIGLTIVAFGTSTPELIVNVISSLKGANQIAMGNIIGSNILNIGIILGLTTIIKEIVVKRNTTWKEIPLTILSAIVVFFLANDKLIDGAKEGIVTRIDGLILLMFFIIFLSYTFSLVKNDTVEESEEEYKIFTLKKSVLYILGGLVLLMVGGQLIVENAVSLARGFGISERIIGLTIVSLGTSLPELTTSIIAALKGNTDIAIGNITGSNLFNVFWILGVSAIICPIPLGNSQVDLIVNIVMSVLLFTFVFTGKGRKIVRWEGILFVLTYGAYLMYLLK